MNIKVSIVLLEICYRNFHDSLPYLTVLRVTLLKLYSCGMSTFCKIRINQCSVIILFFCFAGSERIYLLKLCYIKLFIKLSSVLKFSYDKSHLKSPVSEVNVTDDFITLLLSHSFNGFADNSGTKVSNMKWLCNIGSAVIYDDFLSLMGVKSQILTEGHLVKVFLNQLL